MDRVLWADGRKVFPILLDLIDFHCNLKYCSVRFYTFEIYVSRDLQRFLLNAGLKGIEVAIAEVHRWFGTPFADCGPQLQLRGSGDGEVGAAEDEEQTSLRIHQEVMDVRVH